MVMIKVVVMKMMMVEEEEEEEDRQAWFLGIRPSHYLVGAETATQLVPDHS